MNRPDKSRLLFRSPLLKALRRAARDEQGSELVESALSMLVLLIFIFAVIEFSWGVYSFHYLANAAHEAARYAIVRGGSWTTNCDGTGTAGSGYGSSMCQASTADVANFVANRNFPGISITADDVCVEYFDSVPSSASTSCTGSTGTLSNAPGEIVQVTITYPVTINLPGLPSHVWNFASTSQMVIAQ